MKTVKRIFVLLSMIVTGSSYAQTKEETIAWLNTNGKDFLYVRCDWKANGKEDVVWKFGIQSISNDTLKIGYYEDWNKVGTYYNDVPYNAILYQDVNTVPIKEDKECPQIKIFIVKTTGYNNGYLSNGKETQYSMQKDLYIRYDKNNEENAKRALKAIMHLAKLSGAKENKQTF